MDFSRSYHGQTTSTRLLERVKADDQAAWEQLVNLYAPLVFRWCRQQRLQPDDATDIAQEVFRSVASGIDRFRRERPGDSFRAWLRTIARNKITDHFRRQQGRATPVGGTDAQMQIQALKDDREDDAENAAEQLLLLRRALELVQTQFEPKTWRAFMMNAVEGQPAPQVAEALEMSVQAVWKAKSRVLQRLREEFGDVVELS